MTLALDRPTAGALPDTTLTVRDPHSRTTVVFATPRSAPGIWSEYLDLAHASYEARGVAAAIEYDAVRDGGSTRLFCAVVDYRARVVAGLRLQGPYLHPGQSHALHEWAGRPGRSLLVNAIDARIPYGIGEIKTAFVDPAASRPGAVAAALARTPLAFMSLTGARFMMATAADYVLDRWQSGGGRIDDSIPATPYPDDRYRTRVMFWDRRTIADDADPAMWRQMCADTYALTGDRVVPEWAADAALTA